MRLRFGAAPIALLVVLVIAPRALAQVPETPGEEPKVPEWQTMATVSVLIQNGVTTQRQYSITGETAKKVPDTAPRAWSFALQGDYTYASLKIEENFQAIADSQNVRFTAERALNDNFFLVLRPAFKRNEVQNVEYRFEELGGLGVELVESNFAEIDVIGVIGAVQQDKNVPEVDGGSFVAGTVQSSEWKLSNQFKVNQTFLFLHPTQNEDYRLQFQTALTGAITSHMALRLSYDLDRENIVAGGSTQADRKFSIGIQFTF